jgi:hypothetical protein
VRFTYQPFQLSNWSKNGVNVLSTMSSIHKMEEHVFHSHIILTTRIKIYIKKTKKQKNEQLWTLAYDFILQTMSSSLKSFFLSGPIGFPSKMMSSKLNHNLICLGPWLSSKDLGTNVKLLTNKNERFHWTLLFEPLSTVTLNQDLQVQIWQLVPTWVLVHPV